jgi:integrase
VAKSIKYFAQWLVDQEILDISEFYKIERYVKLIPGGSVGNDDIEPLSKEDEARAFRKLLDAHLSFLLYVGLNFGLRRIEYCNLRISHIELEHVEDDKPAPRIKIENSKGHTKKTRYYYLFPGQAEEWRKRLEYLKSLNLSHDHVFFNPKDPSEEPNKDRVSSWFVKISKITGIHIPSHRLRYTYATRLWEGGVDLYIISYLLGHSRVETTVRYLKISARTFRKKFMDSAGHLFR